MLDVEDVLRNHAAVGRAGHRRQHGGEAGIAAEDLEHQKPLVRARRSAQAVRHLDRPRHAGRESDAVVGPRDVVVHRLGDRDDLEALFVQPHAVAQRVVATDRDQVVDAQEVQIGEHLGSQVVDLLGVAVLEVLRNVCPRHLAGMGA